MRRREFIAGLGGAAAWPLLARAQGANPVVGFIAVGTPQTYAAQLAAFHAGLNKFGFIEGKNVTLEYVWALASDRRFPAMVSQLIDRRPTVIVANYPHVMQVKAATTTIPTVFIMSGDPVALKVVSSLSHPDTNLTGISNLNEQLLMKRFQLLKELLPALQSVAVLINPTNPRSSSRSQDVQRVADEAGIKVRLLHASTESEIEPALQSLKSSPVDALIVVTDTLFIDQGERLGKLSEQLKLPAVFQYRDFAVGGGLLSYGSDRTENFRVLGEYAGRILRGEKVANLPVQQVTKVELVINLKSAKKLGIDVPLSLLGRADEVIE